MHSLVTSAPRLASNSRQISSPRRISTVLKVVHFEGRQKALLNQESQHGCWFDWQDWRNGRKAERAWQPHHCPTSTPGPQEDTQGETQTEKPANVLQHPSSRAKRSFLWPGRDLDRIDSILQPAHSDSSTVLPSVVLHGLGGVDRMQIALKYAYSKLDELDAVIWIDATNTISIRNSFNRDTSEALGLSQHEWQYRDPAVIAS